MSGIAGDPRAVTGNGWVTMGNYRKAWRQDSCDLFLRGCNQLGKTDVV